MILRNCSNDLVNSDSFCHSGPPLGFIKYGAEKGKRGEDKLLLLMTFPNNILRA